MIFAAGLGTRLRPLTNDRPKALVHVQGKPLLEWAILRLQQFGYTDIVINAHHFAEQLFDFVDSIKHFELQITISHEKDQLLNTGGGLLKAASLLDSTQAILVANVDILTSLDLGVFRHYHEQQEALATLAIRKRDTSRYLLFDKAQQLVGWTNIKTGAIKLPARSVEYSAQWGFSGIQLIEPRLLSLIRQQGIFSIIDVYLNLLTSERIMGYPHDADFWLDVGKPESLRVAEEQWENY